MLGRTAEMRTALATANIDALDRGAVSSAIDRLELAARESMRTDLMAEEASMLRALRQVRTLMRDAGLQAFLI